MTGRGSVSRAGTASRDPNADPGNQQNMIINSPDNIEKERKYAQLHLNLQREFSEADTNKDGRLMKTELVQFLMSKSKADQVQDENEMEMLKERYMFLADILFQQMDKDGDQVVLIDEFVDAYFVEQRRLQEEIEELNLRIIDSETRASQIEQKLVELRKQEKSTTNRHFKFTDRFIMVGSILSVHVIDARDLVPSQKNRFTNAQVKMSIEG